MDKIWIDESKGETVDDGFKKIIAAKLEGRDAKWEYARFVTTTDMLPERFMDMTFDDIVQETTINAIGMRRSIVETYTGQPYGAVMVNDQEYYAMFEKYEQDNAKNKSNSM